MVLEDRSSVQSVDPTSNQPIKTPSYLLFCALLLLFSRFMSPRTNNAELEKKIAELQQENAELRNQLQKSSEELVSLRKENLDFKENA